MTDTAQLADVVLPGASFAEKDGTFTSSERRVQRVRKAVNSPGEAKTDLVIIDQIYKRIDGEGDLGSSVEASDVFDEAVSFWPAMAGMNYKRLEEDSLQWPCPTEDHAGTKFLFEETFNRENGKALFTEVPFVASKELPDKEYPFVLTTGRELFHYHTGTMTRRSSGLNTVAPEAFVEVNPADADVLGVGDGQRLTVSSRRGSIRLKARVSNIVPPNVIFIPFHYKEAAANLLTSDAMDPVCKIMEAKVCAVKIEV
jgi:formate dehydrogenase major subunit/formate dehydrogenase alpha subunit